MKNVGYNEESRQDFMNIVYGELASDSDNNRANRIIDAADEFVEAVQPEIIYCKDCKHFVRDDVEVQRPYGFYDTYFQAFCEKHWDREQGEYIDVKLDDFCSFAERKQE